MNDQESGYDGLNRMERVEATGEIGRFVEFLD